MGEKIIRVAQIIGKAAEGGVEACIMNYYTHMDKEKVQFDFFVETPSKIIDKEKIESLGGRIIIIPSYKHPLRYMKVLKKLFQEGKYDIVHSNMNTLSVFALRAAKKAGIKIRIAHSHSTSNKKEWKRNIIKNLLRPFSKKYATHYFACSELAGRWLFGDKTYERGAVTIIHNAIDVERFAFNSTKRDIIRKRFGLEKTDFVIGHVGRFMPQKNHTFIIDIFFEFWKQNKNAKLLLLGDGPLYGDIVKKVEFLGIKENIIFAGSQNNPEDYYSAMDIFILPSLYEGLPLVLVEAQYNGLKCFISTEVTKQVSIDDRTEFLPLDNPLVWSERLSLANNSRQVPQCENGIYDINVQAVNLEKMYKKVMEYKDAK